MLNLSSLERFTGSLDKMIRDYLWINYLWINLSLDKIHCLAFY